MRKLKLLYVMNIPSPYRWHLFTRMYALGRERGVDFEVVFLAPESKRRNWCLEEFPSSFPYRFFQPITLRLYGERFFNPRLVFQLRRENWNWIILGGFDNVTTLLLALMRLPLTDHKLVRTEGNLQAHNRHSSGPIAMAKRLLLRRCDAYIVPGQTGKQWLDYYQPDRGGKPLHFFPNVIDNRSLQEHLIRLRKQRETIRHRLGVEASKRIFLTPARLEPVKGLLEFLGQLPDNFGDSNRWLIAGEGSLRPQLEQAIKKRSLEDSVSLLGYVHHDEMPELYAAADVFLLPSLSDPNPLSTIEAAFAGLPLLISKRLGNFPELLQQNSTGWGFDPANASEPREALVKAISADESTLRMMSSQVRQVAVNQFDCDTVCLRLFDFLLHLHQAGLSA